MLDNRSTSCKKLYFWQQTRNIICWLFCHCKENKSNSIWLLSEGAIFCSHKFKLVWWTFGEFEIVASSNCVANSQLFASTFTWQTFSISIGRFSWPKTFQPIENLSIRWRLLFCWPFFPQHHSKHCFAWFLFKVWCFTGNFVISKIIQNSLANNYFESFPRVKFQHY